MADAPDTVSAGNAAAVGGLDDARLPLRSVGYCVLCDALVERAEDGSCSAGHPAEAVAGQILLLEGEDLPRLPRFNWGAFFIPFLWGPAHGQWAGAIFIPIWLFMDSIVVSAIHGAPITRIVAVAVVALTFGFQWFFARRANGVAFRRVMSRMPVGEFVRRQRVWAIVGLPIFLALVAWGVWFDVAVRPTLPLK